MMPVIGDGTYDWTGYIPFDEQPNVFNPPEGFIITANNRIPPYGFKYHIAHDWVSPQRFNRILEMTNNKTKVSLDDMVRFQMDTNSNLYQNLKFVFNSISPQEKNWHTKLINWDGFETMESQEATIFEKWLKIMYKLPEKEIGFERSDLIYLVSAMQRNDTTCLNFQKKSCLQYASDAFDTAIAALEKEHSEIPKWGEVHSSKFPHRIFSSTDLDCFTSSSIPSMGGTATVNVADSNSKFVTTHSASYRQIIDFSQLEKSKFIFAPGQDGNPFAEGYSNFVTLWRDGKYLSFENYKQATKILFLNKKE
jgi:penicillin G amidase